MSDRFTDRLSEYLDGDLADADRRALESHLAECAECRVALEELREIVRRAGVLGDSPPNRDLWPSVASALSTPRNSTRRMSRVMLAIAALLLVAASVFATWWVLRGDDAAPARVASGPRFLLLLHERPDHLADASAEERSRVVDRYRAWARGLASKGQLEAGEKLADDGGWMMRGNSALATFDPVAKGEKIGGYFVIRAASEKDALETARTCPHLERGGWIELRPIDDGSTNMRENTGGR